MSSSHSVVVVVVVVDSLVEDKITLVLSIGIVLEIWVDVDSVVSVVEGVVVELESVVIVVVVVGKVVVVVLVVRETLSSIMAMSAHPIKFS
jgi:hypothetical protein